MRIRVPRPTKGVEINDQLWILLTYFGSVTEIILLIRPFLIRVINQLHRARALDSPAHTPVHIEKRLRDI